jgi:hypothetical protein
MKTGMRHGSGLHVRGGGAVNGRVKAEDPQSAAVSSFEACPVLRMCRGQRESSPISGELHVFGAGGSRTLTRSLGTDFKSSRLAQQLTTICGMIMRPVLLHVVRLLSVLLLDLFESPGVGGASFPPKSPQDFESAVLAVATPAPGRWRASLTSRVD